MSLLVNREVVVAEVAALSCICVGSSSLGLAHKARLQLKILAEDLLEVDGLSATTRDLLATFLTEH